MACELQAAERLLGIGMSKFKRPGAARVNFTFDFGGGVQIVRNSGRVITIGYKYQHISNSDRSPINPGVDVQMFYGGFSIFK
jgi:hypothetical protein